MGYIKQFILYVFVAINFCVTLRLFIRKDKKANYIEIYKKFTYEQLVNEYAQLLEMDINFPNEDKMNSSQRLKYKDYKIKREVILELIDIYLTKQKNNKQDIYNTNDIK